MPAGAEDRGELRRASMRVDHGEFHRRADGARHAAPGGGAHARAGGGDKLCPAEIDQALRVLEQADAARLGEVSQEIVERLQRIAKMPSSPSGKPHDHLSRLPSPLDRRPGRLLGRAGPADRLAARRSSRCCDDSRPPFARWFVGGETNLCHNAVDRHLADARRPEGADLRLDRDRPGAQSTPSASCTPRCSAWRRCCSALGVKQGRPRADLHADDPGGGVRDAGLRAHRRDPFGGVRRLRVASAWRRASTTPSRRSSSAPTPASRAGKVDAVQAAARRGDPACRAQAASRCCWSTAASRRWSAVRRPRPRLGRRCASSTSPARRCRATWLESSEPSATSSTPAARPASPRACSATPAATRWRWPRA